MFEMISQLPYLRLPWTKYQRMDGLNNKHLFVSILKGGSPRSRYQQMGVWEPTDLWPLVLTISSCGRESTGFPRPLTGHWSHSWSFHPCSIITPEVLPPNTITLGVRVSITQRFERIQAVVLEKTPESLLDSKEVKRVPPKGSQPWIFIGRTDGETEAPILWPPDAKSQLTGKDPDAGKDWRQEEKGVAEDETVR